MSLSHAELRRVVEELRSVLAHARLENAWQVGPQGVVLSFHARRAKHELLICAEPRSARLHLTRQRAAGTGEVTPFARCVRQALRGRTLASVSVAPADRIVELSFGRAGECVGRLVAELTGRTANVYQLGPTGCVVGALRPTGKSPRALAPGSPYVAPPAPAPSPASESDRFAAVIAAGGAASYSEAIDDHYAAAEAEERLRALRSGLAAHLKALCKRAQRLLDNLEADLAGSEDLERLRLSGEILKLHLRDIPLRSSGVTLPNDFEPGSPEIEIALAPGLSPSENMDRCFRLYKKKSAAKREAGARAAAARARLDALDAAAVAVQAAAGIEGLEALAEAWGFRPRVPQRPRSGPRKRSAQHRFVSGENLEILVGRSSAGNDELTFRIARGNDVWLHVEGYTGAHVVVRVPKGKSVPGETLLDAATLAIHFSQLRRAGGGPVVYCACKYVTRPRGAKPGQALVGQGRTLHVAVERSRLARLLGAAAAREGLN